ncbi:hypothetical protein GQ55_9G212000 [Panicum hallii var. hallii]|uniref:Uncharacterized protein n=1 Tax=Panicum hallii var. hallii TaxID=1504633 RepID=A0A2T7C5W8_9POAL|nr:hypothetical protein GQ55_9G212000 [Panicum hallii var. hallii]
MSCIICVCARGQCGGGPSGGRRCGDPAAPSPPSPSSSPSPPRAKQAHKLFGNDFADNGNSCVGPQRLGSQVLVGGVRRGGGEGLGPLGGATFKSRRPENFINCSRDPNSTLLPSLLPRHTPPSPGSPLSMPSLPLPVHHCRGQGEAGRGPRLGCLTARESATACCSIEEQRAGVVVVRMGSREPLAAGANSVVSSPPRGRSASSPPWHPPLSPSAPPSPEVRGPEERRPRLEKLPQGAEAARQDALPLGSAAAASGLWRRASSPVVQRTIARSWVCTAATVYCLSHVVPACVYLPCVLTKSGGGGGTAAEVAARGGLTLGAPLSAMAPATLQWRWRRRRVAMATSDRAAAHCILSQPATLQYWHACRTRDTESFFFLPMDLAMGIGVRNYWHWQAHGMVAAVEADANAI